MRLVSHGELPGERSGESVIEYSWNKKRDTHGPQVFAPPIITGIYKLLISKYFLLLLFYEDNKNNYDVWVEKPQII